jgi:hypothetical protein
MKLEWHLDAEKSCLFDQTKLKCQEFFWFLALENELT